VGKDQGSAVVMDYLDRAPFEFSGKIEAIMRREFSFKLPEEVN
jgi:hypothetical protein